MKLILLHMLHLLYLSAMIIFTVGLFIVLTSDNYLRKLIGVGILQNSVILFFLLLARIRGGVAPIASSQHVVYTSPLPHVLMLTAIVVGFATLSLGIALVYKIYEQFGGISESIINDRK